MDPVWSFAKALLAEEDVALLGLHPPYEATDKEQAALGRDVRASVAQAGS